MNEHGLLLVPYTYVDTLRNLAEIRVYGERRIEVESLAYNVTLTTMACGECGGVYAISERYRQQRQQEGNGWTCPYCKCSWGYFKNGENDRLKRELEEAKQATERERKRKEWAEQEARNAELRTRAQKGVVTRIKNRVGNGVCPCCNRTFQDLQRHMHTKHPDYTTKERV